MSHKNPHIGGPLVAFCVAAGVLAALSVAVQSQDEDGLSESQRGDVVRKLSAELGFAQTLYRLPEERMPAVVFHTDDPRNAAETACVNLDGRIAWELRVNERLAANNWHRFLKETMPHEVAHLIRCQMGDTAWKAHDPTWETIVRESGAVPRIYHNYED